MDVTIQNMQEKPAAWVMREDYNEERPDEIMRAFWNNCYIVILTFRFLKFNFCSV